MSTPPKTTEPQMDNGNAAPAEDRERRAAKFDVLGVEYRDGDGNSPGTIAGYAAVFNSPADGKFGFTETVLPGAFSRSLREGDDVRALVDHDASRIIGRSAAGTLRVREDAKGLAVEIDLPDTSVGRDLAVSLRRGDVSQMSIGFRTREDRWTHRDDGTELRELIDVELFDVSAVTFPFYPDTSIAMRSLAAARADADRAGEGDGPGVEMMRMRVRLAVED